MRHLRVWLAAMTPVLGLTLVLAGCKKSETQSVGPPPTTPKASLTEIKPSKYSAQPLVGRVVYGGSDKPEPTLNPLDKAPCPKMVLGKGWYVKDKGVRYTLVFLKPSDGYKYPAFSGLPEDLKKAPEPLTINQPDCHFEPRVSVLHPNQDLIVTNNQEPQTPHDADFKLISGKYGIPGGGNVPVGKTVSIKAASIRAATDEPYLISCNQHPGAMTGYLWKMDHPWAAVSDADGKFSIAGVPVLGGVATADGATVTLVSAKAAGAAAVDPPPPAKLELWVWNEMLGSKPKHIADIDVEKALAEAKPIEIKLP